MSIFENPSDFTVKDLFSYGGFILGAALTYLLLQSQAMHPLICLIGAVIGGFALAFVGENIYQKTRKRPPSGPPNTGRDAPPERG